MSSSQASLTSSDQKAFNFTGKKASGLLNTDEMKIEYTNPSEKYQILEYLVVNSDQKDNYGNQQNQNPLEIQMPTLSSNAVSPFTLKSYNINQSAINLPHSGGGPSPSIDTQQLMSTRLSTHPMKLSELLSKQMLSASAHSKIQNITKHQKKNSISDGNTGRDINLNSLNIDISPNTLLTTSTQKLKLPLCKIHNEPKVFFYKKERKMLCCRSLTALKDNLQQNLDKKQHSQNLLDYIVMADDFCREQYKKWMDLKQQCVEICDQVIAPRGQLNGLFWLSCVDRVLISILSGAYDLKQGQVYIQWCLKVQQAFALVQTYVKKGRADQIQELEREFQIYHEECDKIMKIIRHSDLFKEELLISHISNLVQTQVNLHENNYNNNIKNKHMNQSQIQNISQSGVNVHRRKSFQETQESVANLQQSENTAASTTNKPIEDILRQFYENRQKSMEKPPKESILNLLQSVDKLNQTKNQQQLNNNAYSQGLQSSRTFSHTATKPSSNYRQKSSISNSKQSRPSQQQVGSFGFGMNTFRKQSQNLAQTQQDTKKLIYEVQDVSRDISDNELMLRVCQEVALRDEDNGLNLDAYDFIDRAHQAQEQVKKLKQKKNQLINVLKDRRKSMDAIKRQVTPHGTRGMSYIKSVL
eukprot:403345298